MINKKYDITSDKVPTYQEFCRLFPKAKEAEKYKACADKIYQLVRNYDFKFYNTTVDVNHENMVAFVWEQADKTWRNYYPIASWENGIDNGIDDIRYQ